MFYVPEVLPEHEKQLNYTVHVVNSRVFFLQESENAFDISSFQENCSTLIAKKGIFHMYVTSKTSSQDTFLFTFCIGTMLVK